MQLKQFTVIGNRHLLFVAFSFAVLSHGHSDELSQLHLQRNANDGLIELTFWGRSNDLRKAIAGSGAQDELPRVARAWVQFHEVDQCEVAVLRSLPSLVSLKVGADTDPVAINRAALAELLRMPHLEELELYVTDSVDFNGHSFSELKNLKSLSITADGPINTDTFTTLSSLRGLTDLSLTANQVPTDLQFIKQLKNLQFLNIWVRPR